MGIAIINNAKHTLGKLSWVYRHNERKNTNYSNGEINKEKTKENYWLKKPNNTYVKENATTIKVIVIQEIEARDKEKFLITLLAASLIYL